MIYFYRKYKEMAGMYIVTIIFQNVMLYSKISIPLQMMLRSVSQNWWKTWLPKLGVVVQFLVCVCFFLFDALLSFRDSAYGWESLLSLFWDIIDVLWSGASNARFGWDSSIFQCVEGLFRAPQELELSWNVSILSVGVWGINICLFCSNFKMFSWSRFYSALL